MALRLDHNAKSAVAACASGLLYGMGMRWLFGRHGSQGHDSLMSFSFIFGMPFAFGAIVNFMAPSKERGRIANIFYRPAGFMLLSLALTVAFNVEGLICAVMATPIFVADAILGAMFCRWIFRTFDPRNYPVIVLAALPLIALPVENRIPAAESLSETKSEIRIHAPAAEVWRRIIRVPRIDPSELDGGFSKWMGFPDPVEADLSHEGIGGVRRARFKGNVLFTETIDAWEEGRMLSFSIKPNTAEIPPTTLDEHVIVGGEYFDVLRGTYVIEDLGNGDCILHLSSVHRTTTHFNGYAQAWGGIAMGDIQRRILKVIKKRCETPPSGTPAT